MQSAWKITSYQSAASDDILKCSLKSGKAFAEKLQDSSSEKLWNKIFKAANESQSNAIATLLSDVKYNITIISRLLEKNAEAKTIWAQQPVVDLE